MALDLDGAEEGAEPEPGLDIGELKPLFNGFAEYLMDNFFLPCTACHPSPLTEDSLTHRRSESIDAAHAAAVPGLPFRRPLRTRIRDTGFCWNT